MGKSSLQSIPFLAIFFIVTLVNFAAADNVFNPNIKPTLFVGRTAGQIKTDGVISGLARQKLDARLHRYGIRLLAGGHDAQNMGGEPPCK
jgi:hypothetical protein